MNEWAKHRRRLAAAHLSRRRERDTPRRVPRGVSVCLWWVFGALTMAAGCSGNLPVITFPQLQAVGEIGDYGTERLRTSDACRQSSSSVEGYVQCMQDKGWKFITRGNIYPAPECWSMRSAGDSRQMPMAQCFDRASASAPAPSAQPGMP